MTKIDSVIGKYLKGMSRVDEDSTEDAHETLIACKGFYMKMYYKEKKSEKGVSKETKEILTLLNNMQGWKEKHDSYTPGQAKAIYNIWMGIKKMTGKG